MLQHLTFVRNQRSLHSKKLTDTQEHTKKKKLKWIVRGVLLVGTVVSLSFVPWLLVWAWMLPLPTTMEEQATQAVDHGFSGVVVYVEQKGRTPQSVAAGWHDPAREIPAREDAYFKIGSVSKLYHAVAVAKLVADGRLDLDNTLANYLPELAGRIENADRITLRMLVQHRSGIPNYTSTPDYWAHPKVSADERLALILDHPANFEPDADYEYCNTNYLLLNMIMDRTLGYGNFQFIQERILDPLHLKNTFASISEVNMDEVMSGFHQGYDADLKTDDIGMVATAADVGRFLRALNTGGLFTDKEQKIYSSIYEYEHTGWVPGYESFASYDPENDAVMVTFYSTTDRDLILWNLAEIVNGRFARIVGKGP